MQEILYWVMMDVKPSGVFPRMDMSDFRVVQFVVKRVVFSPLLPGHEGSGDTHK